MYMYYVLTLENGQEVIYLLSPLKLPFV